MHDYHHHHHHERDGSILTRHFDWDSLGLGLGLGLMQDATATATTTTMHSPSAITTTLAPATTTTTTTNITTTSPNTSPTLKTTTSATLAALRGPPVLTSTRPKACRTTTTATNTTATSMPEVFSEGFLSLTRSPVKVIDHFSNICPSVDLLATPTMPLHASRRSLAMDAHPSPTLFLESPPPESISQSRMSSMYSHMGSSVSEADVPIDFAASEKVDQMPVVLDLGSGISVASFEASDMVSTLQFDEHADNFFSDAHLNDPSAHHSQQMGISYSTNAHLSLSAGGHTDTSVAELQSMIEHEQVQFDEQVHELQQQQQHYQDQLQQHPQHQQHMQLQQQLQQLQHEASMSSIDEGDLWLFMQEQELEHEEQEHEHGLGYEGRSCTESSHDDVFSSACTDSGAAFEEGPARLNEDTAAGSKKKKKKVAAPKSSTSSSSKAAKKPPKILDPVELEKARRKVCGGKRW